MSKPFEPVKASIADAYPIPQARRNLYLRIVNGEPDHQRITQALFFLDDHFPPNKLDSALAWLISNGLVGHIFTGWIAQACSGSHLEMHRELLKVVDNQLAGALIAGKNFRVCN